ncbi:hypothetical protein JTB14_032577 [Gonioctena quinquepunctata]|nr:hypothetical protein JTB14_032577 [Gonioctena quinquepunctata]
MNAALEAVAVGIPVATAAKIHSVPRVALMYKSSDGLLVETGSTNQTKKLLELTKFHDYDVSVSPHVSLNQSKGVVTCRDLLNCSVTEIPANLKTQGVSAVRRITVNKGDEIEETASLILTFNRETVQKRIMAAVKFSDSDGNTQKEGFQEPRQVKFSLRSYKVYRKYTTQHLRARAGVAIIIKENIPNRQIVIQSRRQAVAVQVDFPVKLSICSIYLPDGDWDSGDIQEVIVQLPTPVMIVGDFNAHNPLWGSQRMDRKINRQTIFSTLSNLLANL